MARVLTPARIVALILVGAIAAVLVFLRFAPDPAPVSVPAGARAGDVALEPCEYAGEDGAHPADCGTLIVSENPADPSSRMVALPVTRVRATSADPAEPLFFLTGGPGQSNMGFDLADRYAVDRDVVLVGYRGVDGSVRLDCPEVDSAIKRSTDVLREEFFRAYADAYRSCAERLTDDGVDLSRYGLVEQVDDLETARVALGYDRIDLLSESAGTRTALIYAWRYPESIHRSVMIGVNPPGAFLWDPATTDDQLDRFADLCAQDPSCSARTDNLASTMRSTAIDIPDRWLFLPIKDANVRTVSLFGLFETAPTGGASAPMMIDTWLSAAEGDASGFWLASVLGDLMFPELFVRGQYASAAMLDAQSSREYFAGGPGDLSNLGRAATGFGWGGGLLADAWPAAPEEDEYRRVRTSKVETLLIGGELDVSTPPQVADTQLMPYLPNGREVVLPGFGHTGSVFKEQPEAGTHLINTFLSSGLVDDSLYEPQALEFTPPTTHGGLAKVLLGVMLALATLTVLSLVALARRARARSRIRPWKAAALRSAFAVVLGLGGWCFGALVVLTAMPAVRVDNTVITTLSVAVPVGLGIYWSWVHRDRAGRSRYAGLAWVSAGALAGAWMGVNVQEGPLAVVTAVVGSVAAGNLTLILLDMVEARRASPHRLAPPPENAASSMVPVEG